MNVESLALLEKCGLCTFAVNPTKHLHPFWSLKGLLQSCCVITVLLWNTTAVGREEEARRAPGDSMKEKSRIDLAKATATNQKIKTIQQQKKNGEAVASQG